MQHSKTRSFYGDDLAYVHDAGYSGFIEGATPGILQLLASAKIEDGLVVDLGCGSGRFAVRLADAGYDTIGVDVSNAMVKIARRRCPAASFCVQSAWTYPLPRCRAITALGEVLGYRAGRGRPRLQALVRRVHKALAPGGFFIFDLVEIGTDRCRTPSAAEKDDWACLVSYQYDDRHDRLTREITVFRRAGRSYRRTQETHVVQLYDRADVVQCLRQAGFRVRTARHYGGYPLLPGRVAFFARKV